MTISSTTNRVSYTGNGVTTAFAFGYKFLADSDLKVYQAGTLKTITTHYTVTGAGGDSGGTVTFLVAPANLEEVVILRDPAITQGLDLVENDPLPAESVEDAFDKLTMIAQRLGDLVDRAFTLSDSDTSSPDLTIPTPVADELIGWNSAGNALEGKTISGIGAITIPVPIAQGGTGATDAATARTNLGVLDVTGNNTWTGTQTFRDNKFEITDDGDTTKKLAIQASGISTGSTRTWTVGNYSGVPAVPTNEGTATYILTSNGVGSQPTWNAPSVASAGKVVQVVSGSITPASGTSTIPSDDTVPTNTEGTQVASVSITPSSSSNSVRFSMAVNGGGTGSGSMAFSVFRDSTCIFAANRSNVNTNTHTDLVAEIMDTPATTSAVTYTVRCGLTESSGGSWFWGDSSTARFGSAANGGHIILEEIAP